MGLAIPVAGVLSGCAGLIPGQQQPPRLFRLTPKSTFSEDLPVVDWQLVVEVPISHAGLNTTRIALNRNATELEYYARSSWADLAPNMAQTLTVESFENSDRIVAVGRDSLDLRADYVLKLELREFQAEYLEADQPSAHVRINAKLVRMPERAIIGSFSADDIVAAKANRMEDIVTAFDDALGTVMKDIVEWTLTTGEQQAR